MSKDNQETAPRRMLVVGGGLAGSFFAAEAALAGHAVLLQDLHAPRSASRVAAGLYNVVTGRVASLTWQAPVLLAALERFLSLAPFQPLRAHLHPLPIYRPYRDAADQAQWATKALAPEFAGIARHCPDERLPGQVLNPHGGLEILPCGWLDTGPFLDHLHQILAQQPGVQVLRTPFAHADLDPSTGIHAQHGAFDAIVFAEGTAITANPWFRDVKVHPLKGQVLEFEAEGIPQDQVVLRKSFIVPLGQGRAVAGSTYEHQYADLEPTEEGRAFLQGSVEAALCRPVHVTGMRAGTRPTTPNRRPILGRHPQHPRLHILNGMGTKGVLQAPWCAHLLLRWMDGQEQNLPDSVDVSRFFEKNTVT